jgi:hypothetical protein
MRAELLAQVQAFTKTTLGTFSVVAEMPWTSDGNPLYVKNLRRVYVGPESTDMDPIIDTLDGSGFAIETQSASVYYACDAKQLPANYQSLTDAVKLIRLDFVGNNWAQRRVTVTTTLEADILVTELEFTVERVVNN